FQVALQITVYSKRLDVPCPTGVRAVPLHSNSDRCRPPGLAGYGQSNRPYWLIAACRAFSSSPSFVLVFSAGNRPAWMWSSSPTAYGALFILAVIVAHRTPARRHAVTNAEWESRQRGGLSTNCTEPRIVRRRVGHIARGVSARRTLGSHDSSALDHQNAGTVWPRCPRHDDNLRT